MKKEDDKNLNIGSAEELVDKWEKVLDSKDQWEKVLNGAAPVKGDRMRWLTALALEQVEQSSGLKKIKDTYGTEADRASGYSPILIPMIRRITPALIGYQTFGVQPLSGPTGLIFALRATYQGNSTKDSSPYDLNHVNSCIIQLTSPTANLSTILGMNNKLDDVGVKEIQETGVRGKIVFVDKSTEYALVKYSAGQDFDTFNALKTASTPLTITNGTGATIAADFVITQLFPNESTFKGLLVNYSGPYATMDAERLDWEMPEVGFDVDKYSIEAGSRKLKAKFTQELEEDMNAVHGISPEKILTGIGVDEISMEMNREFVSMIDSWAKMNPVKTLDYNVPGDFDGRWEAEKYRNILAEVNRSRKRVALRSFRGQSSFIIMSPGLLSALSSIGAVKSDVDPISQAHVGTLGGMDCFVDLWATKDYFTTGYKGSSDIDAGGFFSPYVPLKIEKGYSEESNQPRIFFRTRYAISGNPFGPENYFDKVIIENLPV